MKKYIPFCLNLVWAISVLLILTASLAMAGREIAIAFTGDIQGTVLPGGWGIKKGGLARRAGLIEELRTAYDNFVLVDCGDMVNIKKTLAEERANLMFEAASAMGYDAVNMAEKELEFGIDFISEQFDRFSLPLVSANLHFPEQSEVIKPYVIKTFDSVTVGITGITPEVFFDKELYGHTARNPGESPVKTLKNTLAELEKKVDVIILLSHFGFEGTKNLLRYNNLVSVDVAVAGHDRYLTDPPILVEQTLVVQNSLGGEQLSVLSLQIDDSNRIIGHELENIVITEETAGEDPYLSSRMMAFKKAEHRSRMSDRQVERMEKLEEERKKILQLSPQEFIKKMQSGEIDY